MQSKWYRFLVGVGCLILLFMSLPKIYGYIPGSKTMRQVIEREEINAAALFYSSETRSAGSRKEIEEKLESVK